MKHEVINLYWAATFGETMTWYGVRWDGEPGKSSGVGRSYRMFIQDDGKEPPRLVLERSNEYPFGVEETLSWRQRLLRWLRRVF